jgi:hypothetical protein
MKKSRYTEGQIVKALKEEENGRSVMDISRDLALTNRLSTIGRRSMPYNTP